MELIKCWKCQGTIAEEPTEAEARDEAEAQDAMYHGESGEWCHEACYNAHVQEMIGPFKSRAVRDAERNYRNYMAEAAVDPLSAYLRAKGEL